MIRVGTRGSQLAIWQADTVQAALSRKGIHATQEIIPTFGDQNQQKPVYQYGIQGVFTKALDQALLAEDVDIAVHSLKDVPTVLANGLVLAGVLPRGPVGDVLIRKSPSTKLDPTHNQVIATSSIRRSANWKRRYPSHQIVSVRGNIQTRLQKLSDHPWDGLILAEAAVKRLGIWDPSSMEVLSWLLPAPSQGIVGIVAREDDPNTVGIIQSISDPATMEEAKAERCFLHQIGAGCSVPVGTRALRQRGSLTFQAEMTSPSGAITLNNTWVADAFDANQVERWAREFLRSGAGNIVEQVKKRAEDVA